MPRENSRSTIAPSSASVSVRRRPSSTYWKTLRKKTAQKNTSPVLLVSPQHDRSEDTAVRAMPAALKNVTDGFACVPARNVSHAICARPGAQSVLERRTLALENHFRFFCQRSRQESTRHATNCSRVQSHWLPSALGPSRVGCKLARNSKLLPTTKQIQQCRHPHQDLQMFVRAPATC